MEKKEEAQEVKQIPIKDSPTQGTKSICEYQYYYFVQNNIEWFLRVMIGIFIGY